MDILENIIDFLSGKNKKRKVIRIEPYNLHHCTRSDPCPCCSSSKVLFFPDPKLPCYSFFNRLMREPGKNYVCRRKNCDYVHFNSIKEGMTSLMEIFFLVSQARNSIDLAMYLITHHNLANILIHLHSKGVKVRVITDDGIDKERRQNDKGHMLQKAGIGVKVQKNSSEGSLMHNKFAIIDGKILILGSFNWTKNAVLKNHEAVIISSQITTVSQFSDKFDEMWSLFKFKSYQNEVVRTQSDARLQQPADQSEACVIM